MKSYRDNGLEQISETQLKTTHGHFIASGKNKCKEKNHQLRSCHCFSVGKLWQLTGSRFHTLFNLASLSSNKLLYRKSWYKTSNSRPCPLSTYIHHSHTHTYTQASQLSYHTSRNPGIFPDYLQTAILLKLTIRKSILKYMCYKAN